MTTATPVDSRRPPIAVALGLMAAVLLFGLLTFIGGVVVGSGGVADAPSSASPSSSVVISSEPAPPEPTATPLLETVTCAEPTEAFAVLCETYARIKGQYVDEVSDEDLVDGAVRGMIEYGLEDPYSGYLPPEQYGSALDDLSGEFSGIGAEVGIENLDDPADLAACTVVSETCAMVIVAPLDGSPAEAAGVRAGDHVIAIDGVTTLGESVSTLVYRVRGEAGTDVTLTLRRGERELQVTITRAVIDLREVSHEIVEPGIGYIRLASFTDRAPGLFRHGIQALLDGGATAIVLDLRGNPGGFITTAQAIAGEFVPAGDLLFTVESGGSVQRWEAEPGGLLQTPSIPVVVLVDEGSASASEIVAGALKDTGRATLVGQPTFGKNTVQVWSDLPNGGGLRITTDRWFTPEHASAAPDGIKPDVLVEAHDDPRSAEDPQLERALEILREG